jgi:hypothetical protein
MGHKVWIATACLVLFAACQSRPVRELAIADVALKSAQKVKADALAPDAYRQAENYYLRAKKDFADGYFDSSRKYADLARTSAEKAEYLSLLKQSKLKAQSEGGGYPSGSTSDSAGGSP